MNILFDYIGLYDTEHILYMVKSGFNKNALIGGMLDYASKKHDLNIKIICYEYIKDHIPNKKIFADNITYEFIFLKNTDVLKHFSSWHEFYSGLDDIDDNIEKYRTLYKDILCDFNPNIGCGMSNGMQLEKIMNIPVLHYDQCFLDRFPFSSTVFIKYSHNKTFYNYYGDFSKLPHMDTEWISQIREGYKDLFDKINPFKQIVASLRKKFNKIILIPLGQSGLDKIYTENQVTRLFKNILQIPSDIGIIVTSHPMLAKIHTTEIMLLQKLHPNIIFDQNIININFCSQYLIHLVDGIIADGSSLAIQTILFQKPLFCITKNINLPDNIYYNNLADMHNIIDNHHKNTALFIETDKICYHLLTRIAIPASRYITYGKYRDVHYSHKTSYDIFIGNYCPKNTSCDKPPLLNTDMLKEYYLYDIALKLKYSWILKIIAKNKFIFNRATFVIRLYNAINKLLRKIYDTIFKTTHRPK